jgi:uncharacterized protein YndB with AHSA1/START domain
MSMEIGNFETKVHPRDLKLTRIVKAPRKLVFECLTQAKHLVHFWAPKPYTTPKCKVDLRPGGKWLYTFRSPEGQEHDCEAIYREVDAPKKLVMESSVPGPGGKPFFTLRQTITLEDKGKETGLVLEFKVIQANPGSEPFLGGMEQGTNGTLDNLVAYAAKIV